MSSENNLKKRRESKLKVDDDDDIEETGKKSRTSSSEWNKRQNHSEIEKRRRDKMNTYITELSRIIPVGTSHKLDKLTVLRMAVQRMKMLKGSLHSYTEGHNKPSFLSDDELKNLILLAPDGFLFVVGCDRGRILYVSESVSQTLQYRRSELLGTSWFDILHPKDLAKVKEQLTSAEISRRDHLIDAKTLLPVKTDILQGLTCLCPGSRRSFFCRMRCKATPVMKDEADTTTGISKKKSKPQSCDKRYTVIHFTGYVKSWASCTDSLDEETDGEDTSYNMPCLVAVGRVHLPLLDTFPKDSVCHKRFPSQPTDYISKHTVDGKFIFIDQKATLIVGWLPQELLGSSMFEYFHKDDMAQLTEIHKIILQSADPRDTQMYRFLTKDGLYLRMKSQWKIFRNPWTKDIEYIISTNSLFLYEASVDDSSVGTKIAHSQSCTNLGEFISSPDEMNNGLQSSRNRGKTFDEVLTAQELPVSTVSSVSSPVSPLESCDELLRDNLVSFDFFRMNRNQLYDSGSDSSIESVAAQKQQEFNHKKNLLAVTATRSESACYNTASNSVPSGTENDLIDAAAGKYILKEGTNDSSDEAAMAMIMSLLEADGGLVGPVDFSNQPWPLP